MNREEFINGLKELNIKYDEEMLDKLVIYKDYLKEYNEHTNLTAIKEDEDIYLKHFFDSLTITKVIDLNTVDNLLDVGTGAGFPGIPIKIMNETLDITLVDSLNKRVNFLNEIIQSLELDKIQGEQYHNFSMKNV